MTTGHTVLILTAYAVTALSLGALTLWTWIDHRRQSKLLADLEAKRGGSGQ